MYSILPTCWTKTGDAPTFSLRTTFSWFDLQDFPMQLHSHHSINSTR